MLMTYLDRPMSEVMNSRRCKRIPCGEKVRLGWEGPNGEAQFTLGQCIDISATGVAIKIKVPIEQRTYVTLRAEQIGLAGRASVRYCIRRNAAYHVGLEFSGGLKYVDPALVETTLVRSGN